MFSYRSLLQYVDICYMPLGELGKSCHEYLDKEKEFQSTYVNQQRGNHLHRK